MRLPSIPLSPGLLALAAVAAAGASANWWLLTTPIDVAPHVEHADSASAAPAQAVLLPISVANELPETLARPVFSSTRRPPEPTVEAQAQQTGTAIPKAPDNMELRGFMRHNPKRMAVLIRSNANMPGSWVRVGESVEGWMVREIRDDRAIIETNGQRYELQISYRGRSPTGP